MFAAWLQLRETQAPIISAPGGSLTTPGAKAGVLAFRFNATDAGAGVYRVHTYVDGAIASTRIVDPNGGRCADAVPANADPYEFEYRQPCSTTITGGEASLDTRSYEDGARTVEVVVEDAAGNETSAFGPQAVSFANAPAPAPGAGGTASPSPAPAVSATVTTPTQNGSNASAHARLAARFTVSNRATRTIRYGQRPTVTGTLRTPAGTPVAGAAVQVLSRSTTSAGAWKAIGTARTDAQGAFRFVVPVGASRVIRFAYSAQVGETDYDHTTDTTLNVTPSISLRVDRASLRNGQQARFRGTVPGAPAGGRKLVEMQVVVGGRWRTFATTQMRNGRFTHSYRFRRTHARTTYRFRARIRADRGWTFATGRSAVRKVHVRP